MGIDEGGRQVQPSSGQAQHSFDEVSDLLGGQDGGGQLGSSAAGDEDPAWLVDPDLFHLWVIEERLQRAEPGYLIKDRAGGADRISERWQGRHGRPVEVVRDHLVHQAARGVGFEHRVQGAPADEFAHLVLDYRQPRCHPCPRSNAEKIRKE